MKKYLIIVCCLICSLVGFTQKTKKAIFIIVDGIAADVIEQQPTPSLDAIAAIGGYTRAIMGGSKNEYNQTPTISAVGYNSLLTGTWVNKHNVWGNGIEDPNYHYYTIFRLFKEQYPSKKIGVFSTWLDNRTKLIGENLPQTGRLIVDYHFDGLELDTIQFPHDKNSKYVHLIDEAVVDNATKTIRENGPDLSWIYLQYTDDMGHRFGDSEEYYKAIALMDAQIGRIWESLRFREKKFNEAWEIYITTDHGRDQTTGKGHGGQSERERSTWIVTNAKNLNEYFKKDTPSIVDIAPSILKYLNVKVPNNQLRELDGVSLTGELSAIHPSAKIENDSLKISWKSLNEQGNMNIYITHTNEFKQGRSDKYELVATVPNKDQQIILPIKDKSDKFYKIVLEAPHNLLNRWIIIQ